MKLALNHAQNGISGAEPSDLTTRKMAWFSIQCKE
jgi:hypothetical protein